MLSCDSPDSGDYHSPHKSPGLSFKRDTTPPPSARTLFQLYGDLTWAPVRTSKRRRAGKIVPIPFKLEEDDFELDKTMSSEKTTPSNKSLGEHSLATGDSFINQSLELLTVSTDSPHGPIFNKSTPHLSEMTPPTNIQFIYRQYGDLTHAPSSDRVISHRTAGSPKVAPRRLSFDDDVDENNN